jgi:hypothetical protein
MRDMIKDNPVIVLSIVFVMESIVAMHSLWPGIFSVFTEVNALPLDEESARHHERIGSAGRSPI